MPDARKASWLLGALALATCTRPASTPRTTDSGTLDATRPRPDAKVVDARAPRHEASAPSAPRTDILTQHVDNLRTGANLRETSLTAASVATMHTLFTAPVDGQIYAQPLVAHAVATESGTRDALFVESMEDTAFAFDADDGTPLWRTTLGTPAASPRNIGGDNGILATPVIDRSTETMYLVIRDCDPNQPADAPRCAHRLVALDIRTGLTRQTVPILGAVATEDGGSVTFDPDAQWSRAGLLLESGRLYVAFTAGPNGQQHEEGFVYHGWVFGYRVGALEAPPSVYCSTPSGSGGGIWQSGTGLASDGAAVFFETGNRVIGTTTHPPSEFPPSPVDTENSVVRLPLPTTGGTITTYFDGRPYLPDGNVFQYMGANDIDMSQSGPVLVPGTHQLVASSKAGIVYNVDRDTMASVQTPLDVFTNLPLSAGQTLYVSNNAVAPKVSGAPVFWSPGTSDAEPPYGLLYLWPQSDFLKALQIDLGTGLMVTTPRLTADNPITSVGGMLFVSANGATHGTGLVWATTTDVTGHGRVWAFDAETLASLWSVTYPDYAKWVSPVVVNGKLYVASSAPGATAPPAVIAFGP